MPSRKNTTDASALLKKKRKKKIIKWTINKPVCKVKVTIKSLVPKLIP